MRVPRVTEQQVRITPLPNARQRLSVSADTFGAQRARRLSQTAEGVADLGDDLGGIALDQVRRRRRAEQAELDQLALRSEADAEQGFARWQSAATDTLAGFQSLQGMDAVGTYQAALAELAGLETRIGEEIGDAAARALFAQQVTRRLPDFQASLARHHEAQLRAYRATAAETRIQSAVGAALTNPDLMSGALAEIAAVSAQQGEALDLPAEALAGTVAETVRGQTSRIHFGRVEQLLSQGQSAAALAHLEDYGGQMTEADRAQLELKAAEATRRDEVLAGYRAIATGGELPAALRRAPEAPGEAPDSPERPGPLETGDLPDATRAEVGQGHGLSPRMLRAQAAATAQAEAQVGSPQAGLHGGYLAQLDRLATADLTDDPEAQGQIAELLTADYEAEVAARSDAKATALQEVYRGLRDGDYRPASLPPDLAVLLSEAERAEIEAWWQGGLAVAPDAALFEGLIALPPDALLALDLSRPELVRHLSESETARLQSLQAELRRQRGRAPAEGGEGIGDEAEGGEAGGGSDTPGAPLTELNAALEALGVGASGDGVNETTPDPWGVNHRRISSLPDRGDPRGTQVAVGIFGDDEGGEADDTEEGEEGADVLQSAIDFASAVSLVDEEDIGVDIDASQDTGGAAQGTSSSNSVLPAEIADSLRGALGDEPFEQLVSTLDVMDMAERMGLDSDLVVEAGSEAVPAIAATLVYSQLEERDKRLVLRLVHDLHKAGYGRLAFDLRGLIASQRTFGEPHNRYAFAQEPIPLAEAQNSELGAPQLHAEMEARLRQLVGDKTFEQIWYRDAYGMARLMDIDPRLVEAAGAEGTTALAAAAAFSQIPQRERILVNKAIQAVDRAGHGKLAFQLRGLIGSQNSLGKDHNRYAMTNEELLAANRADERMLAIIDGARVPLRFLPLPPQVRVPVGVMLAVFRYGLRNNLAKREAMIEERER